MADVERIPPETRTEMIEVKPERFILALSAEEAAALRIVTGGLTGGGDLRELMNAIYRALKHGGVEIRQFNTKLASGRFVSNRPTPLIDPFERF